MSQVFSRLDQLLGSEVSSAVVRIPSADVAIEDCLDWNQQAFVKWTGARGVAGEEDAARLFTNVLLRAEKELGTMHTWGDLTQKKDLERAVKFLLARRPPVPHGAYLTSDSAFLLLAKHPPQNLLAAMQARTVEDLFSTLTPLDAVALTRHTESHEWQDKYLEELGKLGPVHFETRPIRTLVLERDFLGRAARSAERELKPWSSSHNKETGTLTFYTFDTMTDITTPNLLLTMLFFHYYFEVLRAARLARVPAEDGTLRSGSRFEHMIRSTRSTFSFANPNVHSEALHWEDAISYLNVIFPKLEFREYVPLLPCGEFFPSSPEPSSLNIVDRLWDLNLDSDAAYFKHDGARFLYHFREAFWSEIVQTLRRLSKSEMRSAVFKKLELDDHAFTELILNDADAGIDIDLKTPPWLAPRE